MLSSKELNLHLEREPLGEIQVKNIIYIVEFY